MLKKKLCEGILQYIFEPQPRRYFGYNIIALINENKVILIDTGYEEHSLKILEDLNNNGLTIEKIIISHFHDDHMNGLKVLPKTPIYGSSLYQVTLDMWTKKEDHKYFIPTIPIEKPHKFNFGKHEITMIPFPGHSVCTILTNINNHYIHIADELMFSNEGIPILPSVHNKFVKRHIESLIRLRDYSDYTLIPGHGNIIKGKKEIEHDINNRIAYLKAVLNSNRKITYEEAVKGCDCTFLHSEWHKGMYD